MSLRFVTAGESHGPGLTAIVEGLPAGLELRPGGHRPRPRPAPARPRPRRAHEDREGPRRGHRRGPPRAHARQPGGAADREPRLPELGGADEPVAGGRGGGRGPPAAPRPRRPRRHPEVRPHRRPQRARARVGARDRRAGGRRRPRQGVPARRSGWSVRSHVTRIGSGGRARAATTCAPADFEGVDESPVRSLDAEASEAMVAEIDAARKANESLGGEFEVIAFGLVPGHRLARLLGGAPRRPARAGDHVDPGDEGRGHRRRLRAGRAGGLEGARRDLLVGRARLLPRDQPRRAASRAA